MRNLPFALPAVLSVLVACGSGQSGGEPPVDDGSRIVVDGSSTVFPLSEAVADRFHESSRTPVSLNESGTSAGMRLFCSGRITIAGASRPITEEEIGQCRSGNVELIELPVAYDGIVVAVHQSNYWASNMTIAELRTLFGAAATGRVLRWNQVRAEWPDRELHIYAPGRDSGTYDTFVREILEPNTQMRTDYDASEDDNYIVRRIVRDPGGVGFFGYGYYALNRGVLRAVSINDGNELNGAGAVAPSPSTIADGTYQPLSRPLFIYVNRRALERPDVLQFVELYLREPTALAAQAGMVTLRPRAYELALTRLQNRTTGSIFAYARLHEGLTVEQAMAE